MKSSVSNPESWQRSEQLERKLKELGRGPAAQRPLRHYLGTARGYLERSTDCL